MIINTSGQHADLLARECDYKSDETLLPVLGKYFECVASEEWDLPKANIYPVPNPKLPFLGLYEVHIGMVNLMQVNSTSNFWERII